MEGPHGPGQLMRVLIVEGNHELGQLWRRHIVRYGHEVVLADSQSQAMSALAGPPFSIVVLNLVLEGGSAFAVADVLSYRHPQARVIFVTNSRFFSDGSIFQLIANTAAFLPSDSAPADLAAVVDWHGQRVEVP
jgi:DNA-binding response OmpR family regulator